MVDAVEQHEEYVQTQEHGTEFNDFAVLCKQFYRERCKSIDGNGYDAGDAEGEQNRGLRAFVCPFFLAGTDVLGYEGGCGKGEAVHRQHDEHIDFVVAAPAGHDAGTEVVDVGLYEDIGECGDDGLDPGGKADGEYSAQDVRIQMQVMPGQTVDIFGGSEKIQDQECGYELRQDRRKGNAGNAEVEDNDKQQVKNDIQDAGQDQVIQGPRRITDGTQDPAADVVDQQSGDTGKVDGQVGDGACENIVRCCHKVQHRFYQYNTDAGKEYAQDECSSHDGLDGVVQFFVAFSAEEVSDDDAGTDGKAVKEKYEQVHDHGCGTDGCECLGADEVSDNDGVHGVVQHLEYVAEHQGQGEQQDLSGNIALCQIAGGCFLLGHMILPYRHIIIVYVLADEVSLVAFLAEEC